MAYPRFLKNLGKCKHCREGTLDRRQLGPSSSADTLTNLVATNSIYLVDHDLAGRNEPVFRRRKNVYTKQGCGDQDSRNRTQENTGVSWVKEVRLNY